MVDLSHVDERGQAKMVNVDGKPDTERMAVASGEVRMAPSTLTMITQGEASKGDVLAVARVAGIMAAKKTPSLIPLCHPLMLSSVNIKFEPNEEEGYLGIEATVRCLGKTGVEMEALTAVSVAALTVYDMLKAVERDMVISNVRLMEKKGGKSGHFLREGGHDGIKRF